MSFAVGIDLGTTNTVVGAVRGGVVATLADAQGDRLLPSVVSFHPSGSVLVGRGALDRRLIDVQNTIYSVKRLIGRPWASTEVQQSLGKLPFALKEGTKGATAVTARGDTFSLPEISAFVLRQAKALAEQALGTPVEKAVITVPANFNDLQRAATKTAGRLAGLDVLRILNEPTAAALAYGPQGRSQERIAVYDLGGGTFDVTVLDLVGNVFEVLATAGDTSLGGDDIDVLLADRMAEDLLKRHRFDARATPTGLARLRILGEEMKCALSVRGEHVVEANDLVPGDRGAQVTWRFSMTRPELEWAALPLVERTLKVCQQALDASGCSAKAIDRVILVGGATRMPIVARKVEQFFGRAPIVSINPDEVVALGAGIQADLLDRSRSRAAGASSSLHPRVSAAAFVDPLKGATGRAAASPSVPPDDLLDLPSFLPVVTGARPAPPPPPAEAALSTPTATPTKRAPTPISTGGASLSLPGEASHAHGDKFLPGATSKRLVFDSPADPPAPTQLPPVAGNPPARPGKPPLPAGARKRMATPLPSLVPAALDLPAHALPEPAPENPTANSAPARAAPLLIDVTPLSLSVETVGGFCDQLIEANTPVPCDRTRSFATASDGQTTVRVRVAQGQSERFVENTFLGEVELSGIAASLRGEAPIAVTFEIDADGILNVRALDVKTGRETTARLQLVGAASDPSDLEAMRARQAAHPLAVVSSPR